MSEIITVQDLETLKKHEIFEAEVLTGKVSGLATGANIDYATNAATGQTQKTLPAILRDLGFEPASFDFTTGGTLGVNDRDKAVLWPISGGGDGDWYYWEGALPKVVPPASTPHTTGGIADGAWRPVGDITLRGDLASPQGGDIVYWSHLNAQSLSMTVSSRLRKKVYASELGVTGLTSPTYNAQIMQEMVDQSSVEGTSAVFDVSCSISQQIQLKSNCTIFTPRNVTIKAVDGVDMVVIGQGPVSGLTNVYMEGGTFDGNQQNAPKVAAASVIGFGVCDKITIKGITAINGSGYGFGFQANFRAANPIFVGCCTDVIVEDCHAIGNGIGTGVGGNHDGFDFKYGKRVLINGCTGISNFEKGIHIRGEQVFLTNCMVRDNAVHGFGFSCNHSSIAGQPQKPSQLFAHNLYAEGSGQHNFSFGEGIPDGGVTSYTLTGSNLVSRNATFSGFHFDAQNADFMLSDIESDGSPEHGLKVVGTGVKSLNVTGYRARNTPGMGLLVQAVNNGPIVFSGVDIDAGGYGVSTFSTTPIVVNGGVVHGEIAGPLRVDATAAIPIFANVTDKNVTYKKGDIIANTASLLTLKLGMEKVVLSSTVNINNITPLIENREVSLVSSGNVTYQSSASMVLKTSPTTIAEGFMIKFVAINGKWRQI